MCDLVDRHRPLLLAPMKAAMPTVAEKFSVKR